MKWYKFNINELTDELYGKYFSLMTDERKKYTESLKNKSDKKLTVAGEMLAKKALCELESCEEVNIIIRKDKTGKPYAENIGYNISISHSGDYAVCAVSENAVGIDIEKRREIDLKTARRFCNENELRYILENDSIFRFFEIWTAKEAAFKAQTEPSSDFKKIDTAKFQKQYFNFCDYTVCIITLR